MREGGSTRADWRPGLCKTCAFCIVQVHFNPICSCNYAFHKNGHRRSTRAELSNMFAEKWEACVHISLKSWNGGLPFILVGFGSSQGYIFPKNTKKKLDTSHQGGGRHWSNSAWFLTNVHAWIIDDRWESMSIYTGEFPRSNMKASIAYFFSQ